MRRGGSAGFTLVELMVGIAILAIIVSIAVPSFRSVINNNRLTSAANEASALLQTARGEAIRRNQVVVVCPVADPDAAGAACGAVDTARGLVARLGASGTILGSLRLQDNIVLRGSGSFTSTGTTGTSSRIVFRPDGFARTNSVTAMLNTVLAVCIPTTAPPENVRLVSLGSGSRVMTRRSNGNGACNAPTTDTVTGVQ